MSHCIAGVVKGDYRLSDKEELIFCATDGESKQFNVTILKFKLKIIYCSVTYYSILCIKKHWEIGVR